MSQTNTQLEKTIKGLREENARLQGFLADSQRWLEDAKDKCDEYYAALKLCTNRYEALLDITSTDIAALHAEVACLCLGFEAAHGVKAKTIERLGDAVEARVAKAKE
jgi:hypothetical protein